MNLQVRDIIGSEVRGCNPVARTYASRMAPKTTRLELRLSEYEATALDAISEKTGLTKAEILRTAIRTAFAVHFPAVAAKRDAQLAKVIRLPKP